MTLQHAIESAIKGGWNKERARVVEIDTRDRHEGMATSMLSTDRALLDPSFWRALGKSEGWADDMFPRRDCGRVFRGKPCSLLNKCSGCGKGYGNYKRKENWIYHMHSLIDCIAEGGTLESFFEKL